MDCTHCWHVSTVQHTVTNHCDYTCCWCGKNKCESALPPSRSGHGPHFPSACSGYRYYADAEPGPGA